MFFKLKEFHKSKEWRFALSLRTTSEYNNKNLLNIAFFGLGFYIETPEFIKPLKKKRVLNEREYEEYIEKMYGFCLLEDALHLYFGIQPGHWSRDDKENSDRSKVFFLPWTTQRRTHVDYLNPDRSLFGRFTDRKSGSFDFDTMHLLRNNVPKIRFSFTDYDGADNEATCYLTTSVYRRGTSWCKFIGYILPPKKFKRLEIEFKSDAGPTHGSWKSGVTATSIDVSNESVLSAFENFVTKSLSGSQVKILVPKVS